MSNEAVGAYIRALVELQPGLTLASVLRTAQLAPNYLGRMERAKTKEPSARALAKLIRAAHGSLEHLDALLSDGADAELGESLARQVRQARTPAERRQALDQLIVELESDPRKIDQLLAYGSQLREEDRRRKGRQ